MNKNLISVLAVGVSALLLSTASNAYECGNIAQYQNGQSYTAGQIVKNTNRAFSCTVGGWCSIGGPYEPGVGWAWTNAWSDLGSCGTVTTSSSVAVSSKSSSALSSSLPSSSKSSSSVVSSSKSSASSLSSSSRSSQSSSSSSSSSANGAPSLYSNNFQQHTAGAYTAARFSADWGFAPGASAGVADNRLSVVTDPLESSNRVLRVTYKANQIGGSSASVFTYPIPGGPHTQLWLQYKVMFDNNFTWVKGGKLPGLAGYNGTKPTGCVNNSLLDGFSARFMWRENGNGFLYLYNPVKQDECGDYSPLASFFTKGRWYTITSSVELGTANQYNGVVTTYIDGIEVSRVSGLMLRNSTSVSIDKFLFETFFGGSTTDWAPTTDQYSYFDNITISTTSRLSEVTTGGNNGGNVSHPITGYSLWQSNKSYSQGNRVYLQDSAGTHHYYQARWGVSANKSPLQNSLPENYVGVYSPVRLDNGQPWVELINP
ncbi:MAG: polysaccharide lyase [Cellvibrio sp.]|uniref:polysaccharide lyase n=1 Tax=Cellvibrio sp. TaxID=1965322 RepID=UPI0031A14833